MLPIDKGHITLRFGSVQELDSDGTKQFLLFSAWAHHFFVQLCPAVATCAKVASSTRVPVNRSASRTAVPLERVTHLGLSG
jgi:hypothetical protein